MDWTRIDTMDPNMLVGIVNTALRNHYDSLEELCSVNDVDIESLRAQLASGGYAYNEAVGQFR